MSDIRFNNWYHQSGTGGVYQDGSGNVGIGSSVPTSNLDVAGTVAATTFVGNVTGNATGITTTQITVGDTFLKTQSVGIGTTTTTGRNAGINTALGELIYNVTSSAIEAYANNEEGWVNVRTLQNRGITATGGITNDYTDPTGNTYRAHIFTSSGTFAVTDSARSTFGDNVEYLVVAGGGGGSGSNGISGGAGAGGLRTNVPGVVDAGANSLTGAVFPAPQAGGDGSVTIQ